MRKPSNIHKHFYLPIKHLILNSGNFNPSPQSMHKGKTHQNNSFNCKDKLLKPINGSTPFHNTNKIMNSWMKPFVNLWNISRRNWRKRRKKLRKRQSKSNLHITKPAAPWINLKKQEFAFFAGSPSQSITSMNHAPTIVSSKLNLSTHMWISILLFQISAREAKGISGTSQLQSIEQGRV